MWINFNINNYVRVKLTDHGRDAHREWHRELLAGTNLEEVEWAWYTPPEEDAEGWSKWQLWELMQRLGPKCMSGAPVPFLTEIQINVRPPDQPKGDL